MRWRLPCCVESSETYEPKARYALRMLLLPLGIDPQWVGRKELGERGVYYGPSSLALSPTILSLGLSPETESYFEGGAEYPRSNVRWHTWEGESWPVLFADSQSGELDLVASAFFWLSGWQEVTSRVRDRHGRFPYKASLQAFWGTAMRPVTDAYRERLAVLLGKCDIPVERRSWGAAEWAFCPTHDVDYLRKWRRGMIYREVVLYFLCNHRSVSVAERLRRLGQFLVSWARTKDVYRQAFERLYEETKQRGGTATFFLKAGAHGSQDVFYNMDDPFLLRQIDALEKDHFEVGFHPSYHAHTHAEYFEKELGRVMTRAPVVSVRQHFLRYAFPATLRLQERTGLRIDSTLGFAESAGFRNATCLPFQRFDVQANQTTQSWEMPLAVMDSALFNRCGLSPEEAIATSTQILETCQRFNGVAVMLWHSVLWDEMDHPGWGRHFIETLDAAISRGATMVSLRDALAGWLGKDIK